MDRLPTDGLLARRLGCACVVLAFSSLAIGSDEVSRANSAAAFANVFMSPMGRIAQRFVPSPILPTGRMDNPPMRMGQLTIAVDSSGQHVVVGFNDPRGFSRTPISTAGFMFSDDGGNTFTDGGDLPVSGACELFGHPQVRYAGGSSFIYTAIVDQTETSAQTLAVYRSYDYGHSWKGPFEITAASSPPTLDRRGEAADKEFIDVDPQSGRVLVGWTTYAMTPLGPTSRVCTTYSDDVLTGNPPTWSRPFVLDPGTTTSDSSAMPRFGGNGQAFVIWKQTTLGTHFGNIAIATSRDDGATWSAAKTIRSREFPGIEINLAGDASEDCPCLAVDQRSNAVYVAYSDNSSGDGGDVMVQRSVDAGETFAPPVSLTPRPGQDGAQWCPWLSSDPISGELHLTYLDESLSQNSDLTVVRETMSEDQGRRWSEVVPISPEPFDVSLGTAGTPPNIGEYMESVAQGGQLYCAFPKSAQGNMPAFMNCALGSPTEEIGVSRVADGKLPFLIKSVTAVNQDGLSELEPGDSVRLTVCLAALPSNRAMNLDLPANVEATLSTDNPHISVVQGRSEFLVAPSGQETPCQVPFQIELKDGIRPSEPAEMNLQLTSAGSVANLPVKLDVGKLADQLLLQEDFSGKGSSLPSGWKAIPLAGLPRSGWARAAEPVSGAVRLDDGESSLIDSLQTPGILVPDKASTVSVDFDIAYNTRVDASAKQIAYSGCSLKLVDETAGAQITRPVEGVATEFVDMAGGQLQSGYKHRLAPSADPNCDQSIGVWAGSSKRVEHVHLEMPALPGHLIRLRWDYTNQPVGFPTAPISSDMTRGFYLGNVVVKGISREVVAGAVAAKPATFSVNEDGVIYASLPASTGMRYELVKPASHAQMWVHDDGAFGYRPKPGYRGADEFSYRLVGSCTSKAASIHLMVNPILKRVYIVPHLKSGSHYLGNIALTGLAPISGLTVSLKTSDPGLRLPATVVVKPGANSQEFPLETAETNTPKRVRVDFDLNGVEKSLEVQIIAAPPVSASAHEYSVMEGTSLGAGVATLLSGCRIDRSQPVKALVASEPKNGSLEIGIDGSFVYTPRAGFNGADSFAYVVRQNGIMSDPAEVSVRVLPSVLGLRLAQSQVIGGQTLTCTIGVSGKAPRGGELVYLHSSAPEVASAPDHVLIPEQDGRVTVAIKTISVKAPESVTVTADTAGVQQSASFEIVPRMPIETNERTYRVAQTERLTISSPGLLASAIDPNPGGAELARTAVLASRPGHGEVTINGDGSFLYVPADGFSGWDQFSYVVRDGISDSKPTAVNVLVEPSIADMTFSQPELASGSVLTGELDLAAISTEEPLRIELEADRNDCVDVPETVLVPKGGRSATFTIKAKHVTERTPVYVEARLNGERKTVLLVVRP